MSYIVARKCNESNARPDREIRRLTRCRAWRLVRLVLTPFEPHLLGGMRALKRDGMEKVLVGLTDLKMVSSVCIK